MTIGKSWYGNEGIGLRVRVRYLWDTVKKLDWTYAHNSIDFDALIDLIVFDSGKKIEKNSNVHRFLWAQIENSVDSETE